MGAVLTYLLGLPAVAACGWQMLRPPRVTSAPRAVDPGEQAAHRGGPRQRQAGDTDAYAEAVNFHLNADNGVRVHHDDEEAA